MSFHIDLVTTWLGLVENSEAAQTAGTELLDRYGEPHRLFHNVDHLTEVLSVVEALAANADDAGVVQMAAWFHHAVHDPVRRDNEHRSALLARSVLPGLGVTPTRVTEVTRLVLLTRAHDPRPGDRNGAVLCDADLAVLATEPDLYHRYRHGVRAEYSHVDEPAFAAGRVRVLRELLSRPSVYRTVGARRRFERAARANMEAELRMADGYRDATAALR
jgi:predicted metal-dependent HD superfamily phosphohydrolase